MSSQQKIMNIRTATLSDANAIANLHVKAWRAAYINIVAQSHLDNLSVDDRTTLWQRVLSDRDTAGSILVAEEDEHPNADEPSRLLGFVNFGSAMATTDDEEKIAELRAIYIDPEYWARGVGQRLWKAAQQQLMQEEEKFTSVVVRVFARNERAIRFYRAAGFEGEGKGVIEVGGEGLEIVRMRKGFV